MPFTTADGTEIFYKDWGSGQPVVFSHGWPLSSDDWDNQMLFFLSKGYRVIAHDRRGHGRGPLPGPTRREPRVEGCAHQRSAAADGAANANPEGLPKRVFDGLQAQLAANRSEFYRALPSGPFYNYDKPGVQSSEAVIENWWRQAMMGDALSHYDGIVAFSQTHFTDDLKKITIPVLVTHSVDDQIVPYVGHGVRSLHRRTLAGLWCTALVDRCRGGCGGRPRRPPSAWIESRPRRHPGVAGGTRRRHIELRIAPALGRR